MSFRITVRGDGVELRGQISNMERVNEIARALEPTGVMVLASPYEPRGLDDDLAEQHTRLEGKAGRE